MGEHILPSSPQAPSHTRNERENRECGQNGWNCRQRHSRIHDKLKADESLRSKHSRARLIHSNETSGATQKTCPTMTTAGASDAHTTTNASLPMGSPAPGKAEPRRTPSYRPARDLMMGSRGTVNRREAQRWKEERCRSRWSRGRAYEQGNEACEQCQAPDLAYEDTQVHMCIHARVQRYS